MDLLLINKQNDLNYNEYIQDQDINFGDDNSTPRNIPLCED